jgi:hypothetical protein
MPRRAALVQAAATLAGASASSLAFLARPRAARASKLPAAADSAWAALTGAPPDLFFPAGPFLGTFDAASTLMSAETPLGEAALPPQAAASLARARAEDLGRTLTYRARWIPAPRPPPGGGDWAILDRGFNAAALLSATVAGVSLTAGDVAWDENDPNDLRLSLPARGDSGGDGASSSGGGGGGASVFLRVTKRSEAPVGLDRLETSEFVRQEVSAGGGGGRGDGMAGVGDPLAPARPPRVTASQCFSKWHWRPAAAAGADGGPTIIATQVVSTYLTPDDVNPGGPAAALATAGGKAAVVYTYRLALTPVSAAGQ